MMPKIGTGVIVFKDGKILLGKRRGSHGSGTWCLPGGHLEFNESLEDCAKRETLEEAGIEIENVQVLALSNDIMKEEGKHYLTVFLKADYASGSPKDEKGKMSQWQWFALSELPSPLFSPSVKGIKAFQEKKFFVD